MSSNAQEIRKRFKELLDDGMVHSRTELFSHARKSNPDRTYTEGMLTGALKTLTDTGVEYKCVGRALYQKNDVNSGNYVDNLLDAYVEIFEKTIEMIKADISINPFKLMDLNEDDKKKMKKVEKCIAEIEMLIKDIGK